MEEKQYMKIIDKEGKSKEYEILLTFYNIVTNKNYIVYTDNVEDKDGNLNIFASIYYPSDPTKLDQIETEEEWNEVRKQLDSLNDNNE